MGALSVPRSHLMDLRRGDVDAGAERLVTGRVAFVEEDVDTAVARRRRSASVTNCSICAAFGASSATFRSARSASQPRLLRRARLRRSWPDGGAAVAVSATRI